MVTVKKTNAQTCKVKPPSDEEIRTKLIEPHRHHLVSLETGRKTTVKDGVAAVITSKEWYCFTCKKWVMLYGVEFDTVPKSDKNAKWIDGPPPEVKKRYEELKELGPIFLLEMAEKDCKSLIRKLRKLGMSSDQIRSTFEEVLDEETEGGGAG